MYREQVAANELKQKSSSQSNPLGPARSAIHRRRTRTPPRFILDFATGNVQVHDDSRMHEAVVSEQMSDEEFLPSFFVTTDIGHSAREPERITQNGDSLPAVASRSVVSRVAFPQIRRPRGPRESLGPSRAQRSQGSRGDRTVMVQENVDGRGDRPRSHTSEDYSWEVLHTTIAPDERLPSTHSSFASTGSFSTSDLNRATAARTPTFQPCVFCAARCNDSCSEESEPERQ